ncbi:MAG: hypothetical protein GYB68_06690 [Chloroflexi bacterium]|nr:hypothetical protein [Chloroflexota bacterium]
MGVIPNPADFLRVQDAHWYRIPHKQAKHGIHAEYVAFYFTGRYEEALRWQICYYARRTGHEMVRRVDLLPDEPTHPRAHEQYYKIQLGPLKERRPPIISLRWRRITFIQTTWDRFVKAEEINDLFSTDKQFVDRVYHALKRRGLQPERNVQVREAGAEYNVDLLIPCQDGVVMLSSDDAHPSQALPLRDDHETDWQAIDAEVARHGGPLLVDVPL